MKSGGYQLHSENFFDTVTIRTNEKTDTINNKALSEKINLRVVDKNTLSVAFDEVKRVLRPHGSCWVNLGDTYANSGQDCNLPQKCLVQIPSRFAIEMTDRGWIMRNEIIWYKPSCLPSSVKDRYTVDFEKMFFFAKNQKYHFII